MKSLRILRKVFGAVLFTFGCFLLLTLDQATLVLNVSNSLPSNAFIVYEWPRLLRRGLVVSAEMPAPLADRFAEEAYVKVIAGVPGDVVTHDADGSPCINFTCYPVAYLNGKPVGTPLEPGIIPTGHYAVFGSSEDSLDSRYAAIGLLKAEKIHATGFAVPLPEWEVLASWF